MRPLPVRIRLTLWYLAVVGLTFLLFSGGMYFGMRWALKHSVDSELRTQAVDLENFLHKHQDLKSPELAAALKASAGVSPTQEVYQLTDASGRMLYQTPAMIVLRIPSTVLEPRGRTHFTTFIRRRIVSAS